MAGFKTKVTPEIENLTEVCKKHTSLDLSLYAKYDVKRGLRDINGKGSCRPDSGF
jgi:citrate synthase